MADRIFRLMPDSNLGRWAIGLIAVMPVLFWIGFSLTDTVYGSVPAGRSIPADIAARPFLALTMLSGMAAGVSAMIIGLISILREKDRGLLVFLATLIGALLTLYLIAEFAYPH